MERKRRDIDWYQRFGERLLAGLKARRMSRAGLARVLGIDRAQVTRWLQGATATEPEMLARIAIALRVSGDDLLGLDAKKAANPYQQAEAGAGFSAEEAKAIEEIGRSLVHAGRTIARALSAFQRLKKRRRRAG